MNKYYRRKQTQQCFKLKLILFQLILQEIKLCQIMQFKFSPLIENLKKYLD